MIRIPELVTFDEKQKRIQNIVDALDIQKCLHTGRFLVCINIYGSLFALGTICVDMQWKFKTELKLENFVIFIQLHIHCNWKKRCKDNMSIRFFSPVSSKESSSYFHVTWTDMIKLIISVIFKYLNPLITINYQAQAYNYSL